MVQMVPKMLDQIRRDGMRLNLVKDLYDARSRVLIRFTDIWRDKKDSAENFEYALDALVFAHLALRCEFPLLLPTNCYSDKGTK
jgi:hypothetical protein